MRTPVKARKAKAWAKRRRHADRFVLLPARKAVTGAAGGRADYGIDAPPAVAAMVVLGAGLLAFAAFGHDALGVRAGPVLLAEAALMIWGSRVGRCACASACSTRCPGAAARRCSMIGCGRGLMLIGAAKRLTTGRAHGVDVWKWVDQSGNRRAATEQNARREGVADRVEVHDGDARTLPFADRTFDVVLSSLALHTSTRGRSAPSRCARSSRVLRPGGRVAIIDVRSTAQYAQSSARPGSPT
jgi:SAM-dependent methyltransferase